MKSSAELRVPGFAVIASLASLGAFLMLVAAAAGMEISFLAGRVDPGHLYLSWRREILFLVSQVTGPYLLTVVFVWAILTGILIAIGAGIRQQRLRPKLAMTALLGGAIVALGLAFFAEALSGLWPRTNGPDLLLTLLLLAYSLVAPWSLGRMMRALPWVDRPRIS
jgi:hypothetical protein